MEEKLYSLLDTLGIEIGYQDYSGNANTYIIYGVPHMAFVDSCDDEATEDDYLIAVAFWTNELSCLHRYKEVIDLLSSNGFIPQPIQEQKEDGFYGKIMKFEIRKEK